MNNNKRYSQMASVNRSGFKEWLIFVLLFTIFNTSHASLNKTSSFRTQNKAIAAFSYTNSCLGSPSFFTDESNPGEDIVSWYWNFGDGNNSNTQNPEHTYATSGSFYVSLSIEDTDGNTSNIGHTVNVYEAPTVDFITKDTACTTGLVFFYNNSTPSQGALSSFYWEFPDNHISYEEDTYFVFLNPEQYYNVSLLVTDENGCNNQITKNIFVEPDLQISFDADTVCFTEETTLLSYVVKPQEDSIRYFTWLFNDGSPQITTPNKSVSHVFTDAGIYEVKLQASNLNGCTDIFRKNIQVRFNPTADFGFEETYCADGTPLFDLSSGDTGEFDYWKWQYGDGESQTIHSPNSPDHIHFYPPYYNIFEPSLLVVDKYGCKDSIIKEVIHYPCIYVEFYTDTNWICSNTPAIFIDTSVVDSDFTITNKTWYFGDGNYLSVPIDQDTISYQYLQAGNYDPILSLSISGQGLELVDSIQKEVEILASPEVDFKLIESQCFGNTSFFEEESSIHTNGKIERLFWDFDDGNDTTYVYNETDSIIAHDFQNPGEYHIILKAKAFNNCQDSMIKTTIIHPLPQMGFYSDTTFYCGNNQVWLKDTSIIESGYISTRLWDYGDGNVYFSSSDTTTHRYTEEGIYPIKLINISNEHCRDSLTLENYIIVNPVVEADFGISHERISVYEREKLEINNYVAGNAIYNWRLNDSIFWENLYEPLISDSISDTGTYRLTQYTITFSPNGNGTNDRFGPIGKYFEMESYDFSVYNRWGKLVFQTRDFYEHWDGKTSDGNLAPQDTYAWIIRLRDMDGNNRVLRGAVSLIL
ncbi:MAG: hypothetical protein B7C24_16295 [Bacteroidetes bacterium 4572_77]|nr:MAG: hypothetical protein B7C24_16295 [Bacteroidetes bacterium 4572_77]